MSLDSDFKDWLKYSKIDSVQSEEQLRSYESDALTLFKAQPDCVVLPKLVNEVIATVKYCAQNQVVLVPRGAGTGLAGSATPIKGGIVLSTAGLRKINDPDRLHRHITLGPGVRNIEVSEWVAPYQLFYAPDPSSQIACTIGGNIAENSGGVHCLKYGLTLHNTVSIDVICEQGDLLHATHHMHEEGLDLLAVLIGAEGMLGVTTEATLQLSSVPEKAHVLLAYFSSQSDCANAVSGLIAQGLLPAGLEMMDQLALQMVEKYLNAGYDTNAAAALICEMDGLSEEVSADIAEAQAFLTKIGAYHIELAVNEIDRKKIWAGRKNAFPAAGYVAPDYYCMDGTIPRAFLAEVLETINRLAQQYQLGCANVFHAGDGNLHPLILFDGQEPTQVERAIEFGEKILEKCIEVGGTVTGEHGVGLEKISLMCQQFSTRERNIFTGIKYAFDPLGIFNPDKVIPTLACCASRIKTTPSHLPHAIGLF